MKFGHSRLILLLILAYSVPMQGMESHLLQLPPELLFTTLKSTPATEERLKAFMYLRICNRALKKCLDREDWHQALGLSQPKLTTFLMTSLINHQFHKGAFLLKQISHKTITFSSGKELLLYAISQDDLLLTHYLLTNTSYTSPAYALFLVAHSAAMHILLTHTFKHVLAISDSENETLFNRAILRTSYTYWYGLNRVHLLDIYIKIAPEAVNSKNKNGETPLHTAIKVRSKTALMRLLQSKANVNCTNNEGETPLHYIVKYPWITRRGNPHVSLVKKLLAAHANVCAINNQGQTPLNSITHPAYKKIVEALTTPASLDIPDFKGNTPLLNALIRSDFSLSLFFIKHNAQLYKNNYNNIFPLEVLVGPHLTRAELLSTLLHENFSRIADIVESKFSPDGIGKELSILIVSQLNKSPSPLRCSLL